MDVNLEKKTITIFGKSERLETLVNKLASLSGEQVYSLFEGRGIAVPRKMNCMALTSVINNRLKTLHASELSKDYFLRLNYYKDFSEIQLYNLFKTICDTKEYFKEYRQNLFRLILINFVGLNLTDGEVNYLKGVKKLTMEKFDDYFQYISSMCQEQENTFDGQNLEALQEMLANSSSSQEILDLGDKYGITIPTTLKKSELVGFMKDYLYQKGELNKTLEAEIELSTVTGLNNICKRYRIPMSSNMTKTELLSYLFYFLSQCEIVTTSVRRIESLPMYEPLNFTLDLTVFRGFLKDDTRRVIRYEGDENDEFPELVREEEEVVFVDENGNQVDVSSEAENIEIVEEIIVEEKQEEQALEQEEVVEEQAASMEPQDDSEDFPYVDENGNPLDINQIEAMLNGEEIPVAKKEEVKEAKEEAPVVELPEKALPMDDVRENDQYGNEKLIKHTKGAGRVIGFVALGILLALVIGLVIYLII